MIFSTALSFVLTALLLAPATFAASASDWRSRSIYQVVTDRFARDDGQSPACNTTDRKYCGGTWKGLVNQLDYIQNMGFDAVWISPIVSNVEGATAYGEAYHGYWTKDINNINTKFGTADDLKALSAALHARNMYLMVDIVVNHMVTIPTNSSDGTQTLDFSQISPFNTQASFHPECLITDYNNQTNVEQCWLGDSNLPLEDLNTEDDNIVNTMNTWIAGLVKTYNVDGLRIDTVKHVRKDFWPAFAKAAGVFTIGEVLIGSVDYAAPYTTVIDTVLDYPNWYPLTAGFGSTTGNLSAIVDIATQSQKAFGNAAFTAGSFLENQDQPRFQSMTQDAALIKNAMAWPFVKDGIPILYYGQEQSFNGNGDPANREAFWTTNYTTTPALVNHVTTLNAARKVAIGANSNFVSTSMQFISQSDQTALAVSKAPLLTLFTNVGASASQNPTWTIPSSSKLFQNNEKVVDVLTCNVVQADSSGKLTVQGKGGMPQVLITASTLKAASGSKLCQSALQTSAGINSTPAGLMLLSSVVFALAWGVVL